MRGSFDATGTGTSRHNDACDTIGPRTRAWRAAAAAALTVSGTLVAVGIGSAASATPTPVIEAWGYNAYGQLGNGNTTSSSTPETMALPGGATAKAIAVGGYHTLAIGSDGNLYAWGDNGFGQLGNGTTTSSSTPVTVTLPGGVGATEIAAGEYDSFAVGSNGHVYAWGDNALAELGDGSTTQSDTPVAVSLPAGVTFSGLAAGEYTTFAIGSNGTLYGWGYNDKGQLGDGDETTPTTPVAVTLPGGATAASVASGYQFSLVISTTGGLYSMGGNVQGQLGDGSTTDEDKPKAITLAAGVTAKAVACETYTSLAIGSNGKFYAWGYNADGEVGNGTTTNATKPVAITLPGGAAPSQVSGGAFSSMVLTSTGGIDATGQNGYGQLGTGTTNNATTPTPVDLPIGSTATLLGSDSSSYHMQAVVIPAPTTTSTTLSDSVPSPTYGQSETVTATVTGSDGGGTVTFTDGSTLCSAVPLTPEGSVAEAQCTTSSLTAGNQSIGATYSGDNNSLSSPATPLAIDVAPAPLTVTASSAASVYGGATPAVTASYAGFVNGDNVSNLTSPPTCSTAVTTTTPAGTYPSTCTGAADPNYAITYAAGSVMVGPAPLSIAASSGTMIYGAGPPAITPAVTGLQNSDTVGDLTGLTCSTAASSSSPVGTYSTSCTGASDPNYTISYTSGQMIVGAAPLVVTASSLSTTYGTEPTAVTPSYSGFVNGDTAGSLTTAPTCGTGASASSPVGTYSTSCSGAADPNYAITYVDGSVAVMPAPVVVTASSDSMIYGNGVPAVTSSVSGLQNGEGASVLGAGLQCTTPATSSSPVGSYPTSCSGAVDPNYTITYVDGGVSVTPAAVSITASSGSSTYGSNPPAITPTVSGLQNGEDASVLVGLDCSTTAAATSPVGTYDSSCSGAVDANYTISYVDGTVTVSPAPLTLTASSGSMTYGDTPPVITPSADGLQNGETVAVLGAGLECSTAAVSSSPVGTYASECTGVSDPNYFVTSVDGTVTVNPAALTVTASSGTSTYGTTPPAITASYSGFVNGDGASSLTTSPTCTTTATASSPVGTYDSNCSGAVDANYTVSYVDGSVVIGPNALIVVASPGVMTYGGTAPTITPSYVGFVNGDSATSLTTAATCTTTATSSSPVGSYDSSCSGAADANYTISYVDGGVTVSPAPLEVMASSASISYGSAAPNITPSYSGFVNGDSATSLTTAPTCTTSVVATTPVGTYGSNCGGASDANYTIGYADGSVTVTPATLTVTASSGSSTYGSDPPAITAAVSGLQNDETSDVLTGLSCTTTATASSPVGTYDSNCSGAVDANYTISYVDGSVDVTPAAVTVTASSGSSTYGANPPAITATVSGLQNGDEASALVGLVCSTAATSSSPAGTYASSCSGASDTNYTISYVAGSVQVTAAPLVVAASSGTSTYGANPPAIAPSYSGFVNGDGPGSLNTAPNCSTTATANSPVGTYPTTCSGGSDPDYTISYVPGQVVVGTAALVITASSGTMTYGGSAPMVTPTYAGFKNGDGPGSLSTAPTCSTTATSASAVGSYSTNCSGAADSNYTISYVSGSVHVSAAPLTITASSSSITYGSAAPAVHSNVTGLVNGQTASVLGSGLVCTTAAGPSSPVGTYASTCSGAVDANYAISYASGTVTVAPAALTVTATSVTKMFGLAVPTLSATITGFVDGQTLATSGVTGAPVCTTTATASSPDGTYPITCQVGTLHASNYTFNFVAGTLTVGYTSTVCDVIGSVTVNSGQSVLIAPGCWVLGTVTVKPGGALDSEGAVLLGELTSSGAANLRICNTSLALILSESGSTAPTVVGDGTTSCGGSTLIGGVSLSGNSGSVSLQRTCGIGIFLVEHDTGGVTVVNNSILGDLTVTGNTGTVVDRPNSVIGVADLQ
jgi:alpha-tubulin suppressor-like RCC1 family protein